MSKEKQQTAVEWLVEQLRLPTGLYTKDQIIEQAKEMEKQQIIDAWMDGLSDNDLTKTVSEKYYNEKYGK